MDRNGYNPSLFSTDEYECYVCGASGRCERHEVFGGPNRTNSKKYGLWINVCPGCHRNGKMAIHVVPEEYEYLKVEAQELFEQEFPDKDFLTIFGKNYR